MKIIENPDKEMVKLIREGLEKRGGYCPCRTEKTPENKCMCNEFREQIKDENFEGFCHCMLYYKSNGDDKNYRHVSHEEAKRLMEMKKGVILDVRSHDEYFEKHIPGAVLIPVDEIETSAEEKLKDKNDMILVYCRSGRRSKTAAEKLAGLGYKNVIEFGGIIDWPYETEIGVYHD